MISESNYLGSFNFWKQIGIIMSFTNILYLMHNQEVAIKNRLDRNLMGYELCHVFLGNNDVTLIQI